MRGGAVLVCPPHAKSGNHGDDNLPMYVVLATNERTETYDDAIRVAGWYEQRWIVEELPSTAGLF